MLLDVEKLKLLTFPQHFVLSKFSYNPVLLPKQNENFSEDLNKVDEKVEGVGDEVLVSHLGLPDNQLGVEHDEAAEHCKAKPDVGLGDHFEKYCPIKH